MIVLQLCLALFAFLMIYILRIHYRKQNITSLEFGAWLVIWIGFIFFAFFPSTLTQIADNLYISRVFDLLIIITFVILTIFIIITRLEVKMLHNKLEKFSRDSAITNKVNKK